ncbi:hypothetical protein DSM03_104132 [Leeuwenhoekiella aestuarii]|nr:hypothetical protein DSM03_104132 [Leeuwenhoekiella aestuarii]
MLSLIGIGGTIGGISPQQACGEDNSSSNLSGLHA